MDLDDRVRLKSAEDIISDLEWSFSSALDRKACPRCLRGKSSGHTPTCRIGKFLGRETKPVDAAPAVK